MIAGILTTDYFGLPLFGIARILFLALVGIFCGLAGIVGWYYYGALHLLHNVASKEVKAEPFTWPIQEFSDLHQRYIRIFAEGVLIYIGAVIAVWLSPEGGVIMLNTVLGQLWIFPLAGIVVFYFLSVEFLVHRLMAHCKYNRLKQIEVLMRTNFDRWLIAPVEDKSKIVDALRNWYNDIKEEFEWPWNLVAISTVVATLLLPTIKAILDLIEQIGVSSLNLR
jgi:hypothetical protein